MVLGGGEGRGGEARRLGVGGRARGLSAHPQPAVEQDGRHHEGEEQHLRLLVLHVLTLERRQPTTHLQQLRGNNGFDTGFSILHTLHDINDLR